MKRILTISLACLMLLSMLAGCSGEPSASQEPETSPVGQESPDVPDNTEYELKEYVIGCVYPNAGAPFLEQVGTQMEQLANLSNGTVLFSSTIPGSIDDQLTSLENQIAAGINGIVIFPLADSMLPTVTQMCEEAGVYWGISNRTIEDQEIKELVEKSPYYVGGCYSEDTAVGYAMGEILAERGLKKIAIVSVAKGDTTGDRREAGLRKACEEFGIEIVAESRAHLQAADAAQAAESFLAAYSDLDCIVQVASTAYGSVDAIIKVISDSGKNVYFLSDSAATDAAAYFDSGVGIGYTRSTDPFYDYMIANIKVINAIQGTPIFDASGGKTMNAMYTQFIKNREEGVIISEAGQNPQFTYYDDEFISKNLFKWNDPELSVEALQVFMDEYDVFTMAPSLTGK